MSLQFRTLSYLVSRSEYSFQKDAERQKQQYEYTVNERRQQLADLYNSELEMWRSEAISRVETQEDRKARCVSVF